MAGANQEKRVRIIRNKKEPTCVSSCEFSGEQPQYAVLSTARRRGRNVD